MLTLSIVNYDGEMYRADSSSTIDVIFTPMNAVGNNAVTIRNYDDDTINTYTSTSPTVYVFNGSTWDASANGIVEANNGKQHKVAFSTPATAEVRNIQIVSGSSLSRLMKVSTVKTISFTRKPINRAFMPTKVMIKDKKTISNANDITLKVEVTNNALDAVPVWEDMTTSYNSGAFYSFTNTIKETANSWSVSARYTITKTLKDTRVEIYEVNLGIL